MKLYKSSLHYKIYRLVYGSKATFHNNLCPYFFKVGVLGIPLLIILGVFCIPLFLLQLILGTLNSFKKDGLWGRSGVAFLMNIGIWSIFCMIAMWWRLDKSIKDDPILGWGTILWVVIGVLLLFLFIASDGTSEIKARWISWKEKHCPKIIWEE